MSKRRRQSRCQSKPAPLPACPIDLESKLKALRDAEEPQPVDTSSLYGSISGLIFGNIAITGYSTGHSSIFGWTKPTGHDDYVLNRPVINDGTLDDTTYQRLLSRLKRDLNLP